jgi:hypothetical protein
MERSGENMTAMRLALTPNAPRRNRRSLTAREKELTLIPRQSIYYAIPMIRGLQVRGKRDLFVRSSAAFAELQHE